MSDDDRLETLAARIVELERAVDRQRSLGRGAARDTLEARNALRAANEDLRSAKVSAAGFRRRPLIRVARVVSDQARSVADAARRAAARAPIREGLDAIGARLGPGRRASLHEEARIVASIRSQAVGRGRTSGPLVSIVMPVRDGTHGLPRALTSLSATTYPDIELIVVERGSASGLDVDDVDAALHAADLRFPARVTTTLDAGIAGDLLLLLDPEVEPIDPSWLGCLVETIDRPGVAGVGARSIRPRAATGPSDGELSIRQGGIAFAMPDGAPTPTDRGAGGDPSSEWAAATREVPALSGACLLLRRDAVGSVGGLSLDDLDDDGVDLCLRLREDGGRLMYDGRVALWHHGPPAGAVTRAERGPDAPDAETKGSAVDRWAPRLYRAVMDGALVGQSWWREEPLRVQIVGGPLHPDVTSGLERRRWQVVDAGSVDALLSLDPGLDIRALPDAPVRIAFVEGDPAPWLQQPWLQDYDIVLAGSTAGAAALAAVTGSATVVDGGAAGLDAALAEAIRSWLDAPRVGIRIQIASWDGAVRWGDLHFARDLQRALSRAGRPTRVHLRSRWGSGTAARDPISLQLFGQSVGPTRSGQVNVLWQISHPDLSSGAMFDAFDLVFVASDGFAALRAAETSTPVISLHQATDPSRFRPEPSGTAHELLFVANSRGVRRHLLDDLLPTPHELAVYGKAWTPERLDPRYLAGEYVPNDDLGGMYAAAAIVLNDHWPDMRREGMMSNRLYDASAAGAFVITDDIEGLDTEFNDGVVGYHDPSELQALIDRYLADPAARRERAARARQAVLERHTFDHRARAIIDAIDALPDRSPTLRDGPVDASAASVAG